MAPAVGAANFVVNSTADAVDANPGDGNCATAGGTCTLRAAVMEANAQAAAQPASPNQITLPAGIYVLTGARNENGAATGDLDVNGGALTITGAGAGTVIDGNGVDRVFHLGALTPTRFTLSGATIQRGAATTGSIVPGGPDIGGGLRLERNTSLIMRNAIIQSNRADARGGAIGMPPAAGTIAGGTGTMELANVTMMDNSSGVEGGAFFNNLVTRVTDSIITNNRVTGTVGNERGGAIAQSGDLTLIRVILNANTLSAGVVCGAAPPCPSGGALANRGDPTVTPQIFGRISLDRVVINGNRAPQGAGIANGFNATAIVTNSILSGNQATVNGGGLATQGPVELTNVILNANSEARPHRDQLRPAAAAVPAGADFARQQHEQ